MTFLWEWVLIEKLQSLMAMIYSTEMKISKPSGRNWKNFGKLVVLLLFNQAILVRFARSLTLILVRMDLSRNVVYERFTQKNMVISVLSFITTRQRLWLLEHFI